jgi:hypothetical protein
VSYTSFFNTDILRLSPKFGITYGYNYLNIERKDTNMNQTGLQQAMNKYKDNDQLKRKLKIFLGIGCFGILLVGGLILWAGVTTVQHVADLGSKVNVQEQMQNLKGKVPEIPAIVKAGCWGKVQSLMSIQIWLDTPVAKNIASLKNACFGSDIKEKPEPGSKETNGNVPNRTLQPER